MKLVQKLRHRIAKFLWRNNPWTRAVDDIEQCVKDMRQGKCDVGEIRWYLSFLEPPRNKFTVRIYFDN